MSGLVNGTYMYNWSAYGNGTNKNLNISANRYLTVNVTPPQKKINLNWIYPMINTNVTQNLFFNISVNVSCVNQDCGTINITLDPAVGSGMTSPFDSLTSAAGCKEGSSNGVVDSCTDGSNCGYPFTIERIKIVDLNNSEFTVGDTINVTLTTKVGCCGPGLAWAYSNNTVGGTNFKNMGFKNGIYTGNYSKTFVLDNVVGNHTIRGINIYSSASSTLLCGNAQSSGATYSDTDDVIIYVKSRNAKGGTVSTNSSATPFWTNVTNPYEINLTVNQSQVVTWWVNATGRIPESPYEFFIYANVSANLTIGNQTSKINITIKDTFTPIINITYPLNSTYSSNVSQINYTFVDYSTGGNCWYSNSSGMWNSSSVSAGNNITNAFSVDGSNSWTVYCNDSAGNINYANISFSRSNPQLGISVIYPLVNVLVNKSFWFNVSVNISCYNSDCGRVNVSLDPEVYPVQCSNYTSINWDSYNVDAGASSACSSSLTPKWYRLNGTYNEIAEQRSYVTGICGAGSPGFLNFTHPVTAGSTTSGVICYHWSGNVCSWKSTAINATRCSNYYVYYLTPAPTCSLQPCTTSAIDDPIPAFTKSGIIPKNSSSVPFYTNTTNPYNLSLNNGESQIITWFVNATGTINGTYEFFIYANSTDYTWISNSSAHWNVTIMNGTPIIIDNVYPIFYNYYNSSALALPGIGYFNVSVNNTNGTVWLSINNTNVYATNLSSNVYNANYNFTATGTYSYAWYAYGNGNLTNRNNSVSMNFSVGSLDTTAPLISIIYPANITYRSTLVNFTIKLNENSSWCGYSLDGNSNITLYSLNATYFNSTNSTMTEGSHRIVFSCNDSSGNLNTTSMRFFSVDSLAPQISFSSPLNTSYNTKTNTITISTNSDARNVWFNRGLGNETYISSVSKTFSEGSNIIYAYANDSAGNLNTTGVAFFIDSIAPSITVNSPVEKTYTVREIEFNVSTNENSYCWFTINSSNYTMQNNGNRGFNNTITLSSDGSYSVNYYCNDSLNNLATKSANFGVKTVPPQISLNSPAANLYYGNSTVVFNYTPMATAGLDTCELWGNWTGIWHKNDSTTTIANYSDNYFTKNLEDGTYQWNIWCNNTVGESDWSTQGNITFMVDRTPPYISFVSPTGISYNHSIVNIELLNSSGTNLVWWFNGSANLSYVNSVDISLSDGNYNFFAYANDSAGNLNQTNISFYVDTSYPAFENYYDNNATFVGTGIGYFNVTINNTNGTVWLSINNTNIYATNLSSNIYNVSYNFSSEGIYEYYWTSYTNGTSNLRGSSEIRYYTVNETDKISANATLLTPANNSYVNDLNLNLTVNVSDITSTLGDTESGIKNGTVFVYNSTNSLVNQTTTIEYAQGTLTSTIGIVISLVDGVYNWFYSIFDWGGNQFITGNRTFTKDSVSPAIAITYPENNSLLNANPLIINYSVSDAHLNSCWYYDQGYSSNVSIANCANASISNMMEGEHNITLYVNDSAGNLNQSRIRIILDASPPEVELNYPPENQFNDSSSVINMTFNCSVIEANNLTSISLYITDRSNRNLAINQTTYVSGKTNYSNWTLPLRRGNYTWNCYSNDSLGNGQFFDSHRYLYLNFSDYDDDDLSDNNDSLIGKETDVNVEGIVDFNVTVSGNSTYGTFNETREVAFFNSTRKIFNFTYNFSISTLYLNKIIIIKENNSIVLNLSGQLQAEYSKSVYIEDNNFGSLCVKDSEITNISEMSADCNESDETDFTDCIGKTSGVTKNYLTCTDEGSTIRIDNLRNSAIRGIPKVGENPVVNPENPGSPGGGGSYNVPIKNKLECINDSGCSDSQYCFENNCYTKECENNSQCSDGKSCWGYRCVKLFDIKLLDIDSSRDSGGFISFNYYLKAMADISNDVVIDFWLEKDGQKISSGKDTIFIGNMEEKTENAKIYVPKNITPGMYNFYITVSYEKYSAESHREIEIDKNGNIGLVSQRNLLLYVIPALLLVILLLLVVIIKLQRKKINDFFNYEEEWILTHKLFLFLLYLALFSLGIIILLALVGTIKLPSASEYLSPANDFVKSLIGPYLFLIILITATIIIISLLIRRKRKIHSEVYGEKPSRKIFRKKNHLEHGLKAIRNRLRHMRIQRTLHERVKVLEKKGYDADIIERGKNFKKEKMEEWKKKGYDVDAIEKDEKMKDKIKEWRKKGYDVDSLEK